jgi:hypothetical protein
MTDDLEACACSRPQSRSTKGEESRYSPLWSRKAEWLPWKSNGLEHGHKAHRVTMGGHIEEVGDRAQPRKKIKGISSRQWEER